MSVLRTAGEPCALTTITQIKAGRVPQLRKVLAGLTAAHGGKIARLGAVHVVRWGMFENDNRPPFATNFNGDAEAYRRNFTQVAPEGIDAVQGNCEGSPGTTDYPKLRDVLPGSAIETPSHYCTYPDAAVSGILKALDVKKVDVFLDQHG